MFQKNELARLQKQKELLVLQNDVRRLLLATDCQRLRSPETWLNAGGNLARRHPVWTAALAAAAGVMLMKIIRQPRSVLGGVGRLGELASAAFSAWELFRRAKSTE